MVATTASAVRRPRIFYVGITATLVVLILVGFTPTYTASLSAGTFPPFLYAHAAVFLGWTVLLLVQASLVARGSVALHRRLGVLGASLLPVMVVLGYMTAVFGAQRGHPVWKTPGQVVPEGFPFADSLAFMTVPLGDIVLLAVFGAIAVWHRKRPEIHKRAMLLAAIGCMVPPAAGRLPLISGTAATLLVFVLLLAACVAHDYYERGRLHPLNVWGGVAILASVPGRVLVAQTDAWHSFAEWATR
jgi:hypothetical protein